MMMSLMIVLQIATVNLVVMLLKIIVVFVIMILLMIVRKIVLVIGVDHPLMMIAVFVVEMVHHVKSLHCH